MSVYKRKDRDVWQFDVRYKTLSGESKRKKVSGFKSKQAAKDAEIKFLSNIGNFEEHSSQTIEQICQLYIATKEKVIKPTTLKYTNNIINLHIIPYLAKKELRSVNHQTIIKWQNELSEKGLSNKRINGVTKKLREIFNFANKINNTTYNPFLAIEKLKEIDKKEIVVYDFETFKQFESVIDNFEYKVYFNVLFWTGLRFAESTALTWNDLTNDKELIINKSCIQGIKGTPYYIGETKTKESNRTIKLDDHTYNLLLELKIIKENEDGFKNSDFIFGGIEPFRKNTVINHNKKYAELSQVPYMNLHGFRHSHATLMIQKTKDYKVVSKRLGHKTEKETIATYSHLIKDSEQELLEIMNELNK